LAAVGALVLHPAADAHQEVGYLRSQQQSVAQWGEWGQVLLGTLRTPAPGDSHLLDLAADLDLSAFEILTIALAAAVENESFVGRTLSRVQSPVGGGRPTLGLIVAALGRMLEAHTSPWDLLLNGPAIRTGILSVQNETAPLPERTVAVPVQLCLALAGHAANWPGITVGSAAALQVPLPESIVAAARHQARALVGPDSAALLIRCGSHSEARAVATILAQLLGRKPAFVETDKVAGLGPWLRLRRLLPVFVAELAPTEHRVLPELHGYGGPVLALGGPEGNFDSPCGPIPGWTIPIPSPAERATLWQCAVGEASSDLAHQLASHHRHGAGRIAQVGRLARHYAHLAGNGDHEQPRAVTSADVTAAAWTGEAGGLDALAEPLRSPVPDAALVAAPSLRAALDLLLLRCRSREGLVDDLGTAATTRYRPGVRALFTGPSGTGKTLAAGWVATRLGLPLYRVDLANVTSKYIGETEKNLARLLSRAEQAEVILLFDEADSLFGKRTDIRDSNDRFANAQTNYLLQRIESYDGLVLLTSNSKARFDSAFTRRLDVVLEFPLPNPGERRELWAAHLGLHHTLAPAELNQLAAIADLAGGHIRNAVLTAALLARQHGRRICLPDCVRGLEEEYRKLGRPLPNELASGRAPPPCRPL
jgi:hypothetical protein